MHHQKYHCKILDCDFKTSIIKVDLLDPFSIVIEYKSKKKKSSNETQIKYIYKRAINENSLEAFKSSSHEMSWENIKSLKNLNYAYSCLPETMTIL